MVSVEHLSFGYPGKSKLFRDLSLKLEAGRIYGLLGKNGAGKSSLIRNIAGLLYPNSGHVEVSGFVPGKRQPSFLQNIFFLPEEIHLPPVSIGRFVGLYAPFYPNFDQDQFYTYIRNFDIPTENKLDGMSYGQKKKVLISFSLAVNTNLLLMDEPTNGLDIPSKSQFRKIIAGAMTEERAILISTHQVRDLDRLIDSVIILDQNKVVVQESLDKISQRLSFETRPTIEVGSGAFYSEPGLGGYRGVFENTDGDESEVDLEHLFNAATSSSDRIEKLFKR